MPIKKVNVKNNLQAVKKAVTARNKQVARDNKKFEQMSPAEKRVQIARDVLAQLELKRLKAQCGSWLEMDGLFSEEDVEKNVELKDILDKKEECTGCALGGMFMCAVQRADKLKVGDLSDESKAEYTVNIDDVFSYMKKFFSQNQLILIEACFEQGNGQNDYQCSEFDSDEADSAALFLDYVDEPEDRMKLIMQNIILNKGRFVPSEKFSPVQTWNTPGFNG